MHTRVRKTHQGFTLIELSIVLVVIGLIVGGILVGQDLINSAATRATLTQFEKYNTAANTFRNKYGGIPGDLALALANQSGLMTNVGCTGQQGGRDGNGLIDGWTSPGTLAALMGESAMFWMDLSSTNLIDFQVVYSSGVPGCVSALAASSTSIGNYLPAAKIGNGNFFHVYEINGTNWFMLANVTASNAATSNLSASTTIPVTQAYNMDKKVDDGLPTTGNVVAVYINGSKTNTTTAPNGNPDTASTCYNNSSNTYSTNISNGGNPNCALSFKMQGAAR